MSSVYKRNRSASEPDFYTNAISIRVEVTKIACSESVVPKKYRLILGAPMVQTAKDLVDDVVRADSFYPNTAHGVLWRKHYLTLAIADCHRLEQDVQTIRDIGLPVNLNRMSDLADMIDREIGLLKGSRKSARLTGSAPIGERIERARADIAELEELAADMAGTMG